MSALDIIKQDGPTSGRFVAVLDGIEAELTYIRTGPDRIIADHTGVPTSLGGKGVGKALVEALIADARVEGYRITPACSFVAAQFDRHPDWDDVLG